MARLIIILLAMLTVYVLYYRFLSTRKKNLRLQSLRRLQQFGKLESGRVVTFNTEEKLRKVSRAR